MTNFRGRLIGLSFFLFIIMLGCGLFTFAAENNCTRHNYVEIETHEPTCEAEGGTTYQCTECSDTFIGNKKDKLPHTWNPEVEIVQPTCEKSGSITRTCTVCTEGKDITSIPATGHSFSEAAVKAPTCSEEGYTYHICSDCNTVEIVEGSYTPKTAHDYEANLITEPTCQREGYAEFVCKVCAHSYRESVASVDHDFTAEVTPPTHTEQGFTTYTCRFCWMVTFDDYTDPIPYDMAYTLTEPTCTENGLKVGVCRDGCLHTESALLPAVGHIFGEGENEGWTLIREASEELNGLEERVCIACGLTESRSIAYVAPEPEPAPRFSPTLLVCLLFALVLLIGVTIVVLLMILEHAGHKNNRKYALLSAVDKKLSEQEGES